MAGFEVTPEAPTLTAAGEVVGEFIEQGPYLEWLRSAYPGEGTSCQSCHMPTLKDDQGRNLPQYIAHTPGGGRFGPTAPRAPFGMHFFNGGNIQVLGMLKELYPQEADALDLSLERTRRSLSGGVGLRVTPRLSASTLEAEVEVINRTGHKLPTAYPSRRLWLHVSVRDGSGKVTFESGAVDSRTGEIRGLGDEAQTAFEPHHRLITREDQIPVYEAEMRDPAGNHTLSLLRAAGFMKDNRILPRGYQPGKPLPEGIDSSGIAPVGVDGDPDFLPGSDKIRYQINLGTAAPPFCLTVEALFQSVKPSHLGGMEAARSREEDTFLDLYPRHKSPVVVSRQEVMVGQ